MTEPRQAAVTALQARLGYEFRDCALLERALTHASAGGAGLKRRDNERLEFLGDRVLGLFLAERLAADLPQASEGELTVRLHALANLSACAAVARSIALGPALRLAPGEAKTGGRDKDAVLGDACEALLGAVYLDAGVDRCREVWSSLWSPLLADPPVSDDMAKSRLQEWAQGRGRPLPAYRVLDRTGPDHAPCFTVEVSVEGLAPAQASAGSRQSAEKAAAAAMLAREGAEC